MNEIGLPLEVLDSLGRRRYFDYDVAGNVIYKKDPRGTEVRFEYDDLYRVLRQDLQNGSRSQYLSYEYDLVGNIKKSSNGQVDLVYNDADSSYISDPFNRIQKVKQVMPDGTSYTTQYRYDIMGQMTGIRYPNSVDWLTYDYDKMGRLVGIPGFAGNKNNPGFTYDDNSALQSVKTDNGVVTTYQRDINGRITNINANKSGNDILSLRYEYDNANNIISRNDNNYIYDKLNRLQQATIRGYFEDNFTKADMLMGKVDQDYHGEREAEEDVTEQTQIKLDYSARSLIFNLKFEAENICRIELVPEVTSHRVPMDQLEIYYRNGVGFAKLERSQWIGTKDDKGRIIIRFTPVLTTSEIKIHCNYDDLDYLQLPVDRAEFYNFPEKLVTVYQKIINRTETYTYDGLGNRLSEKILLRKEYGWSYEYYPNSNRLKSKVKDDGSEKFEYTYDENGNMISKVVTKDDKVDRWEYSYDLLNQLEQVKKNGEVVSSYVYDPNGFRVEKNGSKGKIHYVPLLNGEVGYRKEFTSGKEYSWVYVGSQKLARVNGTLGSSAHKYFYHNDHLGSCLIMTDENGNKVMERDFSPWGERIDTSDREEPYSEETEDGFTGKDFDEDIGLYYYNARWYDQETGRFTSEDSMADDPNLYSYCGQNPVNFTDPTGHFKLGKLEIKFKTGFALGMAALGAVESIAGTDSTFSNFIGLISAVKGMKDFADYLKTVRTIETTLSNTINPNTGEKYTQKEIVTYIRSLYYQTPKFDTACGSSIDEQAISDMLEQKSPGIMKALGFSKRIGVKDKEYKDSEVRWRADKTVYSVYGQKVDVGHIWTGLDAGINGGNTEVKDLKTLGLKLGNIFSSNAYSILGVTVTGDIVSESGFSDDGSDLMGDVYGAVLGNRINKVNVNDGKFSISSYLAEYFSPKGDWYKAPSEFVKTFMSNESAWFSYIDVSARGIRGQSERELEKNRDVPYAVNSYIFYTKIFEMRQQGR